MDKLNTLLKLLEVEVEFEFPVEVVYDKDKNEWFLEHNNHKYFVNHLLSFDWKDAHEAEESVEGMLRYSADISGGYRGSHDSPPEGPEADVNNVFLELEEHEPIELDHEMIKWDSSFRDSLEEFALEDYGNKHQEDDYDDSDY